MGRRMSCALTIDAVRDRTKTVTRRHVDSWRTLQPGDTITLIEKGMGLPKGAKQVPLADVVVISVRVEPLAEMTLDDVAAEGFGPDSVRGGRDGWSVRDFQSMWLTSHGHHLLVDPATVLVRRIEWRYVTDWLSTPGVRS